MKVQCDVCEKAEALVLCCADEAVLCLECDEKVHAANKLAGKHQRLPLLNPSSSTDHNLPVHTCDNCQEKFGYLFCLEDRTLLCKQCDVSIHTASPYVSSHQRFLVTGVKVALQHQASSSSTININHSNNNNNNKNNNNGGGGGGNYHLNSSHALNASLVESPTDKRCSSTSTSITSTTTTLSNSGEPQHSAVQQNCPLDEVLSSIDFDQWCKFSDPPGSSSDIYFKL